MKSAILQLALMILPWRLRRAMLRALFGYDIDPTARIGFSVVAVGELKMGPNARIGHLTFVKGLRSLVLGEAALTGNLNWITALPLGHPVHFAADTERDPSLEIRPHAAITHRHLIDCTDRVLIGEFSIVGGWRSQILTHAVDLRTCRQASAPVSIGCYCFVGTGVVILKGSSLPDFSVLGAGSTLASAFSQTHTIYGGVPAARVKEMEGDVAFFSRQVGYVD